MYREDGIRSVSGDDVEGGHILSWLNANFLFKSQ